MFILLLSNIVSGSNNSKCGVSLNNQKPMIEAALINLHPNEYSQKFQYYPSAVKLDRRAKTCNTLNDLSNKVFVQKTYLNKDLPIIICYRLQHVVVKNAMYVKKIFVNIVMKMENI